MKAQTRLIPIAALAVLSAVPAFASFELTLITESNSNAIRRVDPENRIVLGSFGANNLHAPDALALDQVNGHVYVANNYVGGNISRITVLNYNTGAFVREWTLGADFGITSIAFRPGFGLYVPVTDGLRLFSPTGSLLATFTSGLTGISSVSYSTDFNEVYGHAANGTTRRFDGSILSGTTAGISNHSGPVNQIGMTTINDRASFGGQAGTDNLVFFNHLSLSGSTLTHTPGFSIRAVNAAHGDRMYAGGVGGGVSYITTFNQSGLQVSDRWAVPGGAGIISMATVVAPEPGTLLAVGAGLAFLAKRRKRS